MVDTERIDQEERDENELRAGRKVGESGNRKEEEELDRKRERTEGNIGRK